MPVGWRWWMNCRSWTLHEMAVCFFHGRGPVTVPCSDSKSKAFRYQIVCVLCFCEPSNLGSEMQMNDTLYVPTRDVAFRCSIKKSAAASSNPGSYGFNPWFPLPWWKSEGPQSRAALVQWFKTKYPRRIGEGPNKKAPVDFWHVRRRVTTRGAMAISLTLRVLGPLRSQAVFGCGWIPTWIAWC